MFSEFENSLEFSETINDIAIDTYVDAREAEYVASLHGVPFPIDALGLRFLTEFREDCACQQQFLDPELPIEIHATISGT